MSALSPYEHREVKAIATGAVEPKKGNVMSATTAFGQVRTEQASTHSKRNAVIVFTVIALFALSFFVGRLTAPSHVGSSTQVATHPQLSPADRAIVANDVASVTAVQLSPADRAVVAGDVASLRNTTSTSKLSPANRAEIANDVATVTPLSQVNTASCIAGRPC